MIINKISKGFQTRSDMPNSNWLDDEWYCVPDDSKVAEKIIELYPRFDFVVRNGELVDVLEVEKTEKEIKEERAEEIHKELNELDKTINRATEDLYELTETTPYASTQEVINRKKELRQELREVVDNV